MNLTAKDIEQLNGFERFLSFEKTWLLDRVLKSSYKFSAIFTGNQFGKTALTAYQYVLRILGYHPIPTKNVVYFECPNFEDHPWNMWKSKDGVVLPFHQQGLYSPYTRPKDGKCEVCGTEVTEHKRNTRTFRFASATLPGQNANTSEDGMSAEVKNTQYPEFKKWLPPMLIKKDITFRNFALIITDPFGGNDIIVEFVSYNQKVQDTAGVQRLSIWEDEEPPPDFHEEQLPRLIAEDGDLTITCTPANRLSWMYDEMFEKAAVYSKTPAICDFLNKDKKTALPIEKTDSKKSIAVFQAATDDNPTLKKEVIDEIMGNIDDPNVLAIRRYGIFKQVSGRIYKDFEWRTHVIDGEKYFPDGIFHSWRMARMIDYHEHNPWAIPFVAISPEDEVFIWKEWAPSPEKFVTMEVAQQVASMSRDYKFDLNLIDPLAAKTQTNTGTSVIEDLNNMFYQLKRDGQGTGGYWEGWDTKSTRGRDEIRKRLKNAKMVGKPFNNLIVKEGQKKRLPTIWVLDCCPLVAQSFKQWRLEEWTDSKALVTKDMKDKPQQKFSHFPTALEAVFKDTRFRAKKYSSTPPDNRKMRYFQGRA